MKKLIIILTVLIGFMSLKGIHAEDFAFPFSEDRAFR
ncbi:hypothetical protein J2S23_000782 [Streptococcus moroccensis]|uniref:Uncharacterized protein n=1 Tax=Streptococcus moroccensis TaxID=1451356 RepID=A0ABT9YRK2_9STRE|nr:hypothetical protein [Streptococcus moroccensis]